MVKYRNRIRRKQFILKTSTKVNYYFNKAIDSIDKIIESHKTLYEKIYENIKSGLDYGYSPRYYVTSTSIYHPSIETEYREYHNKASDEATYELIFDVLVNEIFPNKLSKYSDIELTTGEDENGKYFEVKLI